METPTTIQTAERLEESDREPRPDADRQADAEAARFAADDVAVMTWAGQGNGRARSAASATVQTSGVR